MELILHFFIFFAFKHTNFQGKKKDFLWDTLQLLQNEDNGNNRECSAKSIDLFHLYNLSYCEQGFHLSVCNCYLSKDSPTHPIHMVIPYYQSMQESRKLTGDSSLIREPESARLVANFSFSPSQTLLAKNSLPVGRDPQVLTASGTDHC